MINLQVKLHKSANRNHSLVHNSGNEPKPSLVLNQNNLQFFCPEIRIFKTNESVINGKGMVKVFRANIY